MANIPSVLSSNPGDLRCPRTFVKLAEYSVWIDECGQRQLVISIKENKGKDKKVSARFTFSEAFVLQ